MNKKLEELLAEGVLMVNPLPEQNGVNCGIGCVMGDYKYFIFAQNGAGDLAFVELTKTEAHKIAVAIFSDDSVFKSFTNQFEQLMRSKGLEETDSEARLNAFYDKIFN